MPSSASRPAATKAFMIRTARATQLLCSGIGPQRPIASVLPGAAARHAATKALMLGAARVTKLLRSAIGPQLPFPAMRRVVAHSGLLFHIAVPDKKFEGTLSKPAAISTEKRRKG